MRPLRTSSAAYRPLAFERSCEPHWRMRLFLIWASRMARDSAIEFARGFSQ